MTEERRAEIRARAEKALRGPWKVYPTLLRPTEAGLRRFGPDYVPFQKGHNQIGTAWDHPQLHGPAPVVGMSVGPYSEPIHDVSIDDDDAEFIAHAREDVPDLLDALETTRAALAALVACLAGKSGNRGASLTVVVGPEEAVTAWREARRVLGQEIE